MGQTDNGQREGGVIMVERRGKGQSKNMHE